MPVAAPDPGTDPAAYAALLRDLGDAIGRPTPILPTHDPPVNAIARHRDELGERFLYPFPDRDTLALVQSKREQLDRAAAVDVDIPDDRPSAIRGGGGRRGGAHRLPAARQAFEPRRVQAPLPPPGLPLRDARRARARVRRRGAVRADGAGAHPRRRRRAVHRRQLHRRRRHRPRPLQRPQAPPVASRHRHVPRRRGRLGAGGGRRRAAPAPRLRLPRRVAGGVQARSARRPLQAHGGEPSASGSGTGWPRRSAWTSRASRITTCSVALRHR